MQESAQVKEKDMGKEKMKKETWKKWKCFNFYTNKAKQIVMKMAEWWLDYVSCRLFFFLKFRLYKVVVAT